MPPLSALKVRYRVLQPPASSLQSSPDFLPTSIEALDERFGGLPKGAATEIFGAASSGRTSMLLAILAGSTGRGEFCALVDAGDAFDPASAAAAGIDLQRLLWIRCRGNVLNALKAADLLAHGGGFGVVALDLGDTPVETARRISLSTWFRLRRAVEHTATALLVVEREPQLKQCAALGLEVRRSRIVWSGAPGCSQLLRGAEIEVERRKGMGHMGGGHVCLYLSS